MATTLLRRLNASFGNDETVLWLLALVVVGAALAQAIAVARGLRLDPSALARQEPGTIALVVGLGVLATLGLVTNDSSIAVPATMLIVIVPTVILRATAPDREVAP